MFGLALTAMNKDETTSMGKENDIIVSPLQLGSPSPFDSYTLMYLLVLYLHPTSIDDR